MSRLNLTWRMSLAVGAVVLCGLTASGVLLWQLGATTAAYDTMLGQQEVQHQDRARVIQVTFKKQVQEWKNLLIRGNRREDFQKYEKSFKVEEAAVRVLATRLLADVKDDNARRQLGAFLQAHEAMGKAYDSAILAFKASQGLDVQAADALVKGQDRAPTDLLDAIAARLRQVLDDLRHAQTQGVAGAIRRTALAAHRGGTPHGDRGGRGVDIGAAIVPGRDRAGRVARRNVGLHGGNVVDDPPECRELTGGRKAHGQRQHLGPTVE